MAIIKSTKFLEFKSAKSPSGSDWYYVRRTNDTPKHDSAVVITTLVKINNEYNYLFLKTKRPPLYAENKCEFCLESPAGLIGDVDCSENLLSCIEKELLEELGLKANEIHLELLNSAASAGISSETLSFATAIVDVNEVISEPISDGGIIVERFFVKANEVYEYLEKLDKKEISIAAATVCGIFYAQQRLIK